MDSPWKAVGFTKIARGGARDPKNMAGIGATHKVSRQLAQGGFQVTALKLGLQPSVMVFGEERKSDREIPCFKNFIHFHK